jgi:putative FmdB family regulatory protein
MPAYEYKCRKCGNKLDIEHCVFTSGKSLRCPKCGSKDLEITEVSYTLKPSGDKTDSSHSEN